MVVCLDSVTSICKFDLGILECKVGLLIGTELIQNLYLGHENWLIIGQLHCNLFDDNLYIVWASTASDLSLDKQI